MQTQSSSSTPTGIILIATFWIFFGTWFFITTTGMLSSSSYYSPFSIIPLLIGIGIIMVGWGLLTLKRWAYTFALIFSILGLISALSLISFFISLLSGYYHFYGIWSFLPLISLCFIPMTWYLLKKGATYYPKETGKLTLCPHCDRAIPFDGIYCPYCNNKIQIPSEIK